MEREQSAASTPGAVPRAGSGDGDTARDATAPPLRIERERLPDGRAITYYSRPDDGTTAGGGPGGPR